MKLIKDDILEVAYRDSVMKGTKELLAIAKGEKAEVLIHGILRKCGI